MTIAAISLMRQRDDVDLHAFRRHWLNVHGPLVRQFTGLRHYVRCHVIGTAATNAPARVMRIGGFPILTFDNDEDRGLAHNSAAMAACSADERRRLGAGVVRFSGRPGICRLWRCNAENRSVRG